MRQTDPRLDRAAPVADAGKQREDLPVQVGGFLRVLDGGEYLRGVHFAVAVAGEVQRGLRGRSRILRPFWDDVLCHDA